MMRPGGIGREGAIFTTSPRAAMTIKRRMAASAGINTRITLRCSPRGSRPTLPLPLSPSRANRAATMPTSASRFRSIALAQSMVLPLQSSEQNTNINWAGSVCQGDFSRHRDSGRHALARAEATLQLRQDASAG
jgi:hypothetical protein